MNYPRKLYKDKKMNYVSNSTIKLIDDNKFEKINLISLSLTYPKTQLFMVYPKNSTKKLYK